MVEDDPADVALIGNAVAVCGLPTELHQVGDGEEAMAFLNRSGAHTNAPRPDLVILDLNMPRMNGREALSAVKSDDQLKPIPIVVFTTSGGDAMSAIRWSSAVDCLRWNVVQKVRKLKETPNPDRCCGSPLHRL
ncbi:response regulator [Micromonospora ureilytica]|uniref:response regulator n=1 Tax=Micromonospora ureilytica TaxID=709868 RepID=UPI0033E3BDFA